MEALEEAKRLHLEAAGRVLKSGYLGGISGLGAICADYYLEPLPMLFERCLLNGYWLLLDCDEQARKNFLAVVRAQRNAHEVIANYLQTVDACDMLGYVLMPRPSKYCQRLMCYYAELGTCCCGSLVHK